MTLLITAHSNSDLCNIHVCIQYTNKKKKMHIKTHWNKWKKTCTYCLKYSLMSSYIIYWVL